MKRNASAKEPPSERGDTHPYSQRRGGGSKRKLHVPLGGAEPPPPRAPEQAEGRRKSCQPCPAEAGSRKLPQALRRGQVQTQTPHRRAAKAFSLSTHRRRQAESGCLEEDRETHRPLSKPDSPQSWRLKITG